MCTECARIAPAGFASTAKTLENIGAPGRTRTCDLRFRKPLLYPLSYGGGDGPKRGSKFRSDALGYRWLRLAGKPVGLKSRRSSAIR